MPKVKLNGTTTIPTPIALAAISLILTALLGFAGLGWRVIAAGDANVQQRVTITHEWMRAEFVGIEEQIQELSATVKDKCEKEEAFRVGIVQRVAILEAKAE